VVAGAASVACWFYFDAMTEVRRQWRKLAALRQVITDMQNDRAFMLREYYAQPVVGIDGSPRAVSCIRLSSDRMERRPSSEGVEESAPRLVIFTDYDFPRSACFESQLTTLVEASFGENAHFEYRYAPSRSAGSTPEGQDLSRASLAAEAARLQGDIQAFVDMRRLLFQHTHGHVGRDYAELARRAGLQVAEFLNDMNSKIVRARVLEDVTLASRLGVTEVPAVFLEGRRVPDLCVSNPVFWAAVADELAKGRELSRPSPLNSKEET
jgi:hypothetical protein